MENLATTKVSKIVAQNYRTAKVFTNFDIDFCCNGGIPLEDACRNKGLSIEEVIKSVEEMLVQPDGQNFEQMSPSRLISYIVCNHHAYVESTMPILQAYLAKLCAVHGERHPELFKVKTLFDETAVALTEHMKKEEFILFPFITALYNALENGSELPKPNFGHIDNPIAMMQDEHAAEGSRFRKISALTDHYRTPSDGCQTYKVAYAVLQEFEQDLHKHIHLENNILFPGALSLYQTAYSGHLE